MFRLPKSLYFCVVLLCLMGAQMVHAQTWISAINVNTTANTAVVNWTTAVPADSQVEFGTTAAYGSSTPMDAAKALAHSVTITGLTPGTSYHCRMLSRDSAGSLVIGIDYPFATPLPVSVSVSPTSASIMSGTTQQFTATVSNASDTSVTWTSSAGAITSTGLFTAPVVASSTSVTVTATSVADTTKSASATVNVLPPVAVAISPTSANLVAGAQQQFAAVVTNASNTAVNWTTTAGTVTATGLFTAPVVIANATVTVTATSVQDPTKSASAVVQVTPAIEVSVSPVSATLFSGGQQQFAAVVEYAANTAVTWSATAGSISATGLFTAPIVTSAATVTVRVTSQQDPTKSASATVTVNPVAPTNYSLFSARTPATADGGADNSVNLGMRFTSDVGGQITALRFFKSAANTGTHTGALWSASGTQLATVTFTNETASGWQTQPLATPVAITAGTTYVVSYRSASGHYACDQNFFTAAFNNTPLHVPANGGVYTYSSSTAFPTSTWRASNYYVDVVLSSSAPPAGSVPTIGLNYSSWTFTATQGGSNPAPASVNVTNTGGGTLNYTVSSDSPWLGVSATSGTAPGSISISPSISGLASGTFTGHVTVTAAGATNSPAVMTCTLIVNPIAPQPRTVGLNWQASTTSNVVSYTLYRSSTAGGPYALVASAIGGRSYDDTTAMSGTTYYYVATAVNDAGQESDFSNEVRAVIP